MTRREELTNMKAAELKEIAKGYGLKVSGKKDDIIERILNYETSIVSETEKSTLIDSIKEMTNEEKIEIINHFFCCNNSVENYLTTESARTLDKTFNYYGYNINEMTNDEIKAIEDIIAEHTHAHANEIINSFFTIALRKIAKRRADAEEPAKELKLTDEINL